MPPLPSARGPEARSPRRPERTTRTDRNGAAAARAALGLALVAGCAAAARPKELVALGTLRASPALSDSDRRAFDLLAAGDDLMVHAEADWQRGDAYKTRRDALLGQIKMKTAIAIIQAEHETARIAALDEQLAVASNDYERISGELEATEEEVSLLERFAAMKVTAEEERRVLKAQIDSVTKQAARERQTLTQQLTSQTRRADALDGLRRAEVAIRTAETVDASTYAKAKYLAAAGMLLQARKDFEAERWDEALAKTSLASTEAEASIAVARPHYEAAAANLSGRVRDRALEADATSIAEIKTRLERDGDVQRLVLVLNGLFADGKAVPLPRAAPTLDRLGDLLGKFPTYLFSITGFSDDTAKPSDLPALALARANAMFWALTARGVDPKRMTVDGKGPASAGPSTVAAREKNSRIELTILYRIAE